MTFLFDDVHAIISSFFVFVFVELFTPSDGDLAGAVQNTLRPGKTPSPVAVYVFLL